MFDMVEKEILQNFGPDKLLFGGQKANKGSPLSQKKMNKQYSP